MKTPIAWLGAALLFAVAAPERAARADHHESHPAPAATTPGTELPRTPSAEGARVYLIGLRDGYVVSSPFVVRFGLSGMGIAPAGMAAPNTGHHHLVVDAPTPPLDTVLPNDEHHIHFGKGQTETTLTLPPGEHTLQLVFADHNHVPHDPPLVSEVVRVTVK